MRLLGVLRGSSTPPLHAGVPNRTGGLLDQPVTSRLPRTLLVAIVLLLTPLTRAGGQSLRGRIENLFRFGDCGPDFLLLQNTSGQDAALAFSDALEAGNRLLVDFVSDAIRLSVASIPTPATSSGAVVEFTPGGRIQTRLLSGGPIYAERAPSLGRGKVLAGALFTQLTFQQLRGLPIGDLLFNFRRVDIPGTPGLGNPVQADLGASRSYTALGIGD